MSYNFIIWSVFYPYAYTVCSDWGSGSQTPCSDLVSYRRVFILACTVERIMYSTMKGFNYRKLEIQVLGARPMSEVGFRDVRASPQNSPTPQRHHTNVSVNRCLLPIYKRILYVSSSLLSTYYKVWITLISRLWEIPLKHICIRLIVDLMGYMLHLTDICNSLPGPFFPCCCNHYGERASNHLFHKFWCPSIMLSMEGTSWWYQWSKTLFLILSFAFWNPVKNTRSTLYFSVTRN